MRRLAATSTPYPTRAGRGDRLRHSERSKGPLPLLARRARPENPTRSGQTLAFSARNHRPRNPVGADPVSAHPDPKAPVTLSAARARSRFSPGGLGRKARREAMIAFAYLTRGHLLRTGGLVAASYLYPCMNWPQCPPSVPANGPIRRNAPVLPPGRLTHNPRHTSCTYICTMKPDARVSRSLIFRYRAGTT